MPVPVPKVPAKPSRRGAPTPTPRHAHGNALVFGIGFLFATPMANQFLRFGASPRAAQTLVLGAMVKALLAGRTAVAFDDIKAVALPALRHRILMNFEAEAEGRTSDEVVQNIIDTLVLDVR